jgi:hypothetical protein
METDPLRVYDGCEKTSKLETTPSPPSPPPPGSPLSIAPEFEDLVEVTSSDPGLSIESLTAPTPVLIAD